MWLAAVSAVGSQVEWNLRVMFAAPGDVEGDKIMSARVEVQIDVSSFESCQILRHKNVVSLLNGKPLKIIPAVPGGHGLSVVDGPKRPAQKRMLSSATILSGELSVEVL